MGERERSPEEFHDTKLTGLELINSYLLAQGSGMPRSLDRSLANGPLAPSFLKKINPPRFCWQILPDYTSTGGRVFVLSNQVLSGEARAARGQMAPRACGPLWAILGAGGLQGAGGCFLSWCGKGLMTLRSMKDTTAGVCGNMATKPRDDQQDSFFWSLSFT